MAMPISTHPDQSELYAGDEEHWKHVMECLFEAAIRDAGLEPIRPAAQGSHLIHGAIIHHLSTADLVLVDLSSHNPNVFFELGVRTSVNLPIALVRDEHTEIPFDTAGINTHRYDSNLRGWEILDEQRKLTQHIRDSQASCAGQNPLWRQFGLTIKASEPETNESPLEAKVDLLTSQLVHMQANMEADRNERRLLDDERAMQIERNARLRRADYIQRREDNPEGSPATQFLEALGSTLRTRDFKVKFESPGEVILQFDGKPTSAEVSHARDLAERYGVTMRIRDSSHSEAVARARARRSRPVQDGTDSAFRTPQSDIS